MPRQVCQHQLVPIGKHASQGTLGKVAADGIAKRSQWQRVLDVVFEHARVRAIGGESVRMTPVGERPLVHHVNELLVGDVFAMLQSPRRGNGPDVHLQRHTRAIANAARVLENTRSIPWRCQTREGVGTFMPRE